uniref:Solute carrier family 22 member 11 n=1 Tax=Sus scrofa TaxID=9823 RepID=A0A8D1IEL4_PIG
MAFTELLEQTGAGGLFQALQALTLLLLSIWMPFLMLAENFSAGHRCWAPLLDNGSEVSTHLTPEALLAVSIPPGLNQEPHQCLRFRQPQCEAATEPCVDGWVSDRSEFTSTIVTEWDLVCAHQGLKPLGQPIFMAGTIAGSIVLGLLSHRLGRKPKLSWCCLQVAVATISTIVAPNFLVYCGLRFLSSVGWSGLLLTSTMLTVEWTTTRMRAVTVTMMACSYGVGQMALGATAFALRDWRPIQLAVSVPFFVIFLISWWLPESARRLIIMGKLDQALQELKKVAKINGHQEAKRTLTIEVLTSNMEEEVAAAKSHHSVLDLFRELTLRWRICSFCFNLSYYGLVLDLQKLGRDIFLLQVFFGAVDFLAQATMAFLLRFFGCRTILASSLAMSGLAILANLQALRMALAVLGKACFAVSLTCLMIYKLELLPTVLRGWAPRDTQQGARGTQCNPLIRMTHQVLPLLPFLAYGILPTVAMTHSHAGPSALIHTTTPCGSVQFHHQGNGDTETLYDSPKDAQPRGRKAGT